jgi:sulfatase modifying factor 1
MSKLRTRIEKAQQRWNTTSSTLLKYRWKKMVALGISDFMLSELQENASLFIDAACHWINIDEYGKAFFVEDINRVERDVYAVLLLCIAQKSPRDHILQYLLNFGGFDTLLLQSLGGMALQLSPPWIQERIIDLLAKTYVVDDGVFVESEEIIELEPFEVGVYSVTQALYELIVEQNPSRFYGLSLPVDSVSWLDAVQFCNHFSERVGLEKTYKIHEHGASWMKERNGYRLLSEVEWMVAARGGMETSFAGSDSWEEVAHCGSIDFTDGTRNVANGKPNSWGLFDCSGHVFEWCWDRFQLSNTLVMYGPNQGVTRVRKGGGWNSDPKACLLSYRSNRRPAYRASNTGFRIARSC